MTPLERNDLHAAVEQRYPDNMTQDITPELLRDGLHDLVDSLFVKATDVTPTGGVYLRLRNGKTLWHLGKGVRDKTKLWLRKFGAGTLPAILPEPVLDPNRPRTQAPGTPFSLHPAIGGPATGPAAIAEYTRQVSDGGHFLLTGADLDKAAYPVYQGGNFYATTVTSQHSQRASVRLPRTGAAWDATLTWASTAAGLSEPVLLNTAVLLWGTEQTAAGLTFSIYGRNLAHGNVDGGASYVALQPVGGGPVQVLTGKALDPYCADFVTPANLALGDYYYWPHNGHGGDYGWGERGVISVVATENHVKTHNFGPATYVKLSKTDPALNVATINAAFQQYRHFCTDDDTFPINAQLYPRDKTKWSCVSPTGRTVIEATSWAKTSQYLGMFGSNSWYMGMMERISFIDPGDMVPYKTTPGFYNQSLIDLRRGTGQTGNAHIWLQDVEATWLRPYYEINLGSYNIPEEAQCLHVEGARHFFVDNFRSTGSGNHFGNCGQVFIENYTHRLRNGADHTLYGLHVNGFSVRGFDFQDDDPTSGDGLTRGAGRGPKFGGQGGSNQHTYLRDLNGRLLGPLFTGINPYFDRNQGEMCLYEGNRVVWQNMVVSATATTITFAGPVLSNPAGVANGTTSPDQPAAGVLPDYHLLWIGRGRGIDQVRGIKSVNGNTITLDKPLRVIPDATSFVQVGTFTRGNTLSKVKLTGKRFIVDDNQFGIQCAINFYGGMFDTIADDFDVTDTRHGFIFTPTVHGDGEIDTVAFCQMLNSRFNGQRWVERYEAYGKEEKLFWSFGCSGLRNILVANIEAINWLEARVVFKVVRETSELATYWRPDAPPIDGLVRDGMPVVAGYLNDYRTPAGPTKFPPIPLVAGVVEGFVQQPVPALVAPTAPGVQLVSSDEIGPLEPLPAGANVDPRNGVLSYLGTDPAVLVYVDGAQEIPLDRTPVASASIPVAPGVTYTAGAGINITNDVISATQLTPAQQAQVQALNSPVYLISAAGLTGYATLDDALAVAAKLVDSTLYLNRLYLRNSTSGAAVGSNTVFGGGLALDPSQPLDFSGARVYQYSSSGETLVLTDNAQFYQSKLTLLTLNGQEVALHDTGATDLAGMGIVYLYGSSPDPVNVAAGIQVVDRRSGGGGPTYSAGVGIDITAGVISTQETRRTGTVLSFTQDADYDELLSSTFTVDVTNRKGGVMVKALLGSNCAPIQLDPNVFERLGRSSYQPGFAHCYLFSTSTATGKIQYTVSPRF